MLSPPIWEVELTVHGPIRISSQIIMRKAKSFNADDPFFSDIKLQNSPQGVRASVTTRTWDENLAEEAALYFFGQMLDCLSLAVNRPLYLGLADNRAAPRYDRIVNRIVATDEWHDAFHEARLLVVAKPTFLRALGWYRKGLTSEDAFDRYLALWNSIEIVASKYHRRTDRTARGIINQIWECFITLWGLCENWPYIPGDDDWIRSAHEERNRIAHGIASLDVEVVRVVLSKIPVLKEVAHGFLSAWRTDQLNPHGPPDA